MAKYIDVDISLKKTIKVDCDNSTEAIEIAKNQLSDLEMSDDWLNARIVTFKENKFIESSAKKIAELYHDNFDSSKLQEFLDITFMDQDVRELISKETLDILQNKYKIDINSIKI